MKKHLKIYLIILISSLFTLNVNASTNTIDRTNESNLGVNKKWDITEDNKDNVLNTPYVDVKEKIYDYANIITDEDEHLLLNSINSYIEKTNMDMVILTIDMAYSQDSTLENYAADFYDYNDFGINLENYSGILLLRNIYSEDPYFNIYTFGNAQLYYSYNRCEYILDNIYDNLHNGYYYAGFNQFIDNSLNYYNKGIPSEMKHYYIDDMGFLQKEYVAPIIPALIISLIITIIVISILVHKNKMVKKATGAKEYVDKSSINYSIKDDKFITSHTTSYTISSDTSSSSGGSHAGSSGGGHSAGGGRHG